MSAWNDTAYQIDDESLIEIKNNIDNKKEIIRTSFPWTIWKNANIIDTIIIKITSKLLKLKKFIFWITFIKK